MPFEYITSRVTTRCSGVASPVKVLRSYGLLFLLSLTSIMYSMNWSLERYEFSPPVVFTNSR